MTHARDDGPTASLSEAPSALRDRQGSVVGTLRVVEGNEVATLRDALSAAVGEEALRAESAASSRGSRVVVAELHEKTTHKTPVGLCALRSAHEPNAWGLEQLYVAPGQRQQRIGVQLLFDALGYVARKNATALLSRDASGVAPFVQHWVPDAHVGEPGTDTLRIPTPFVDIAQLGANIAIDLRYAGNENFVGRPVDGYATARAMLTRKAAHALARAQSHAQARGFCIKVFDAYRPVRAVEDFVRWSEDAADEKMRAQYYPALSKPELFSAGYVARHSGHSRGSTLDCTLVSTSQAHGTPTPIDGGIEMGTHFDLFDQASHTAAAPPHSRAAAHRTLLLDIMHQAGFVNFAQEWWHFTLEDEPYPTTYFDFLP